KIKAGGFSCVQLDVSFKDCDATKERLTKEKANMIRDKFRDANLPIVAVSAYTNFVHSDPVQRKKNMDYLKSMMERALDLGSPYVASETGTYCSDSDWVWDDKNATEEAYEEACAAIYELTKFGREVGATFIMENYVNNVIGSIEQVQRVFKDVNMPNLKLICDPTNYFDQNNIGDVDGQLERVFNALEDKMVIAHAKDIKLAQNMGEKHADIDADESHSFRGSGAVELPAAGLGVLNYDLYMKLLGKFHPNIPLIIEHLDEGDIPRAKAFVEGALKRQGV
ncbi:MAG: sugar phosphate isomerase/epimerase, partial [Christensenella sp.]|uniref:sugar phosphate isomerase/epimerase family protein n=1 Tax=Christensenella sp. TaxID=1935934 RepID=UPI002B20E4BF